MNKDLKKSKGLGDTIEKITKATGIDKIVKKTIGNDCGCDERKQLLNKIFPYTEKEVIFIYGIYRLG